MRRQPPRPITHSCMRNDEGLGQPDCGWSRGPSNSSNAERRPSLHAGNRGGCGSRAHAALFLDRVSIFPRAYSARRPLSRAVRALTNRTNTIVADLFLRARWLQVRYARRVLPSDVASCATWAWRGGNIGMPVRRATRCRRSRWRARNRCAETMSRRNHLRPVRHRERLNWLPWKKRRRNTSSQALIVGRSYAWRSSSGTVSGHTPVARIAPRAMREVRQPCSGGSRTG